MELQDRLNHLIDLSGATEREVASLSGLSPQAINFLGSGSRDNPTLKTLRGIAGVFGVSLDWLANGVGPAPERSSIERSFAEARRAHAEKQALAEASLGLDPSDPGLDESRPSMVA